VGQHGATASRALENPELVQAVLDDWRTAPVDEGLRVTLGLVEKLTLEPGEVGPADVEAVRTAGVGDEAIADAVHMCAAFVYINKLADALGFEMLTPEVYDRRAEIALAKGYVVPAEALE
jgi:alkylhydroperoxidase family enzyme